MNFALGWGRRKGKQPPPPSPPSLSPRFPWLRKSYPDIAPGAVAARARRPDGLSLPSLYPHPPPPPSREAAPRYTTLQGGASGRVLAGER